MAEPISGKGMHRVQLADGQLHVLSDKHRVIIQLRSPKIVTDTDAVSPACKISVVLDPVEAVRLRGFWPRRNAFSGFRRFSRPVKRKG